MLTEAGTSYLCQIQISLGSSSSQLRDEEHTVGVCLEAVPHWKAIYLRNLNRRLSSGEGQAESPMMAHMTSWNTKGPGKTRYLHMSYVSHERFSQANTHTDGCSITQSVASSCSFVLRGLPSQRYPRIDERISQHPLVSIA